MACKKKCMEVIFYGIFISMVFPSSFIELLKTKIYRFKIKRESFDKKKYLKWSKRAWFYCYMWSSTFDLNHFQLFFPLNAQVKNVRNEASFLKIRPNLKTFLAMYIWNKENKIYVLKKIGWCGKFHFFGYFQAFT